MTDVHPDIADQVKVDIAAIEGGRVTVDSLSFNIAMSAISTGLGQIDRGSRAGRSGAALIRSGASGVRQGLDLLRNKAVMP